MSHREQDPEDSLWREFTREIPALLISCLLLVVLTWLSTWCYVLFLSWVFGFDPLGIVATWYRAGLYLALLWINVWHPRSPGLRLTAKISQAIHERRRR